jgi:hypothetical protein
MYYSANIYVVGIPLLCMLHAMETSSDLDSKLHAFLMPEVIGDELSVPRSGRIIPGERASDTPLRKKFNQVSFCFDK